MLVVDEVPAHQSRDPSTSRVDSSR